MSNHLAKVANAGTLVAGVHRRASALTVDAGGLCRATEGDCGSARSAAAAAERALDWTRWVGGAVERRATQIDPASTARIRAATRVLCLGGFSFMRSRGMPWFATASSFRS